MKTFKIFKLLAIPAILGLVFSLSYCKKDKETITVTQHDTVKVTVNVHDTLYGKAISGIATYSDNSGNVVPAKGAIVQLYAGSAVSGTPSVSIFTDASGNFKFPYLLPGNYFIFSKYNTANQNARLVSDGFNFATNPGFAVTLGSVDANQNLSLVNISATGTAKISMDSITNVGYGKVTCEAHSKLSFSFLDYGQKTTLAGGFNTFTMTNFVFDEANPENIKINGYTLLSGISTFEPTRDAINGGCVHKTLCNDTCTINSVVSALPETDTARFVSTSVVRYGDGYIAHGTLCAFYKHGYGGIYAPDTTAGYAGPFNQCISKSVDLYFIFNGKTRIVSGTTFYWWFIFEGQFSFRPQTDFYLVSGHFADGPITVNCHVQMQGTKGVEY